MSDEMRLPDDLAAIEARLAAESPPASRIDRDQLMYRAGWAACEAQLQPQTEGRLEEMATPEVTRRDPRAEPGAARGGRRAAAWSFASAALAASLAVAITLQVRPNTRQEVAERAPEQAPAKIQPAALTKAPRANLATSPSKSPALAPAYGRAAPLFVAGFWQADRNLDDSPTLQLTPISVPAGEMAVEPAKTAGELLKEFLPKSSADSGLFDASGKVRFRWPWSPATRGETI